MPLARAPPPEPLLDSILSTSRATIDDRNCVRIIAKIDNSDDLLNGGRAKKAPQRGLERVHHIATLLIWASSLHTNSPIANTSRSYVVSHARLP